MLSWLEILRRRVKSVARIRGDFSLWSAARSSGEWMRAIVTVYLSYVDRFLMEEML